MMGVETSCLSDTGLGAVGGSFGKLEKLSLIWCSSVTDAGLRSFAEKCKSLKSLDLQGCYIADDGLAAVGETCNFLEDLNLRFCEGVTDTGLVRLALGCGRTLRSLGVAACAKVTDVSLEAVGSHCRSLESLSLDSEIIHNNGLLSVAKGCTQLKVLKLQCLNITDEALQAVGIFCLSLESLALYSFQKFTDRSHIPLRISSVFNVYAIAFFLQVCGITIIPSSTLEFINLHIFLVNDLSNGNSKTLHVYHLVVNPHHLHVS